MEFPKPEDQDEHNRLVNSMIEYCKKNGYKNIRVDMPGHPGPEKLGGYIPDLTAQTQDGTWLVCEAEPCSNIDTEHTKGQMQDFVSYDATVVLLVPTSAKSLALETIARWGFADKVKVWTASSA